MKKKIVRFLWVVLLVICAFTLGYTLKPTTSGRTASFRAKMNSMPPTFGKAPPLNFRRR